MIIFGFLIILELYPGSLRFFPSYFSICFSTILLLHPLHELVMKSSCEFGKEESLLLLLSLLIQQYGQPFESCIPECRDEIERACTFMEQHYAERIYTLFLFDFKLEQARFADPLPLFNILYLGQRASALCFVT